jgi:hypothetical protein
LNSEAAVTTTLWGTWNEKFHFCKILIRWDCQSVQKGKFM